MSKQEELFQINQMLDDAFRKLAYDITLFANARARNRNAAYGDIKRLIEQLKRMSFEAQRIAAQVYTDEKGEVDHD